MSKHVAFAGPSILLALLVQGCGGGTPAGGSERGACLPGGGCNTGLTCLSDFCVRAGGGGTDASSPASPLVVSAATRTPRTTTWSVNYWMWMPAYGDDVSGTDALVAALKPALMRVGGYNNDANTASPFDDAAFDTAVAYARAIGAEPIIQVPLLADTAGNPPTPATAAAMVTYANVTKSYGVEYFSIGNEPDLYATQGSLTDPSAPAIPGYTATDYCASATAYVAAMKAVDPTIEIVGPDLSNKYGGGGGPDDWLTTILTTCGDLFDVIAIHRYPFEAKQATLAAAAADQASFRYVMGIVRSTLKATGYADKPLALTEMNIAYDDTLCVLGASPGTVGSALWLADSVGTAIELGLWTSAVWDISDDDKSGLGLIGPGPAHTPRPEYYAYALYADHFGPTLLSVTSAPPGVSAHAGRNQADDATEIVVVNWNESPAALAFSVTGLATAPTPATFILPPVSMAEVELPDSGGAAAWVYGEAEREIAAGPQPLAPGATVATAADGGAGSQAGASAGRTVGTSCTTDAAMVCPTTVLPSPVITAMGVSSSAGLTFGSGTSTWSSYAYAAPGEPVPTAAVTADGDGIQIAVTFVKPTQGNWEGVGLFFNGADCVDASAYTGVKFDFAGSLGSCTLSFGASFSGDLSHTDAPTMGSCPGDDSQCYGPLATVVPGAATTIKVPFTALSGGTPVSALDPSTLVDVEWQLSPSPGADGGACSANFTVSNVAFY
ncbi:MAG TPA: hypothetical protein VI456_00895 [Polyangia bacterium]